MLATFRAHAKGWIAWVFVILVTVPFAFWGVSQYRSLVTTNYVAKVNGEKIMPNDLQQAYQRVYQQRQQALGNKFNPTQKQETALKKQTLQQLITRTLLRQQAQSDRLVAGKQAVRQEISQIPAFQSNGHFDFQQYRNVLAENNLSVSQFEGQVRSQLLEQQLQTGVAQSAFATPAEMESIVSLLKEKRRVAWFVLPIKQFQPSGPPSKAAVEAYYKAHQDQYSTPERVDIAYVRLDRKTLEKRISVTPSALRDYYDSHQSKYGTPPARKAAEILIKPHGNSPKDWAAARKTIVKLLKKVRNAPHAEKTFAELARKHSDDPVSRRNGGSIGYVARGQMPKSFDHALFGIKNQGGVAGPVRTAKGWVLIQLLGSRGGSVRPFSAVKDQVASDYKADHANELYYKLGDKLANSAYEHPNSLKPVAQALGLKVKTVTGVTRKKGTGIASHAKVRTAAFSDTVLKQRQNSPPIKLGNEDAVVLHVTNITPSSVEPLAKVHDSIVAALQKRRAAAATQKAATAALTALRSGKSIADVARAHDAKPQGPKLVARGAQDVPPALNEAVYRLAPAAGGHARYATTDLQNGDMVVYALLGVKPGDVKSLSAGERQAYANQLGQAYATQSVQAYIAWLRSQADVKIDEDNIR